MYQAAAFGVLDRNSKISSVLVFCYYSSKLILSLSGRVYDTLADLTHVCARSSHVNHLGLEAIDEQPGAIALVRSLV